ncbi:nuclear transport factor 2 family protein [Nonomuraea sp. NPDC052116]|uniref:nuclear transport factor 2 family protein n=1 Tax=Nonomuraea sp. NPDC052116 TaxID=3155665 RepID=UPI00344045DE
MTDLDIWDRHEIQQTIGRYSHTFDSGDVDGWVGVFTDDGIFEVVLVGQPDQRALFQGSDELRRFAESKMGTVGHVLHHVSGIVFDDPTADRPRTRATLIATRQLPDGPAISTHGTYVDHWRRTEAGWRIDHRLYLALGYANAPQPSAAS